MINQVAQEFPNFSVIGTTLRTVHSASNNDWGAVAWSRETGLVQATHRVGLEIMDRVGGGDSFASGLVYGLLTGQDLQQAVDLGAAHGVVFVESAWGRAARGVRSSLISDDSVALSLPLSLRLSHRECTYLHPR